jgi:beta-alanine degradation protein BauB
MGDIVEDRILEEGRFARSDFADELRAAPNNHAVGTRLIFENEHVKVWEIRVQPGERAPFHAHVRRYFWTIIEGGIALQRFADGTFHTREVRPGDTRYLEHTPDDPVIHDFENAGDVEIRVLTVELLD